MMLGELGLRDLDTKLVDALSKFSTVIAAWRFGSYGTDLARVDSDLDIGVLFVTAPTLDEYAELRQALQEISGVENIDLVILNGASTGIQYSAITGARIWCANADSMAAFVSLVVRKYEDSQRLLAQSLNIIREVV